MASTAHDYLCTITSNLFIYHEIWSCVFFSRVSRRACLFFVEIYTYLMGKSTSKVIAHKWTMKSHFYESAISISAEFLQFEMIWPQCLLEADRNAVLKQSSQSLFDFSIKSCEIFVDLSYTKASISTRIVSLAMYIRSNAFHPFFTHI